MDDATTGAAEPVTPVVVLTSTPGQAAFFDDPRRLLTLPLPELRQVAADAAREGKPIFAQLRRVYGLVAWAMWNQVSELAYADFERDYAAELNVPAPTLRRWRRDVVASDGLPVPTVAAIRSEAAKASAKTAGQAPSATKNGSKVGAPKIPAALPPGPGVAEAVAVAAAAVLPDPGPPPTLRASIAHLVDHLHDLDPDEAGAAMKPTQLDDLMDWTERAVKAGKPLAKPRTSRGSASSKTAADCPHPITRRIGSQCGACGATVKK
jgi:hypothetical protein